MRVGWRMGLREGREVSLVRVLEPLEEWPGEEPRLSLWSMRITVPFPN